MRDTILNTFGSAMIKMSFLMFIVITIIFGILAIKHSTNWMEINKTHEVFEDQFIQAQLDGNEEVANQTLKKKAYWDGQKTKVFNQLVKMWTIFTVTVVGWGLSLLVVVSLVLPSDKIIIQKKDRKE